MSALVLPFDVVWNCTSITWLSRFTWHLFQRCVVLYWFSSLTPDFCIFDIPGGCYKDSSFTESYCLALLLHIMPTWTYILLRGSVVFFSFLLFTVFDISQFEDVHLLLILKGNITTSSMSLHAHAAVRRSLHAPCCCTVVCGYSQIRRPEALIECLVLGRLLLLLFPFSDLFLSSVFVVEFWLEIH